MKLKIRAFLFLFVSIVSTCFCEDTLKLHRFYEQNGEVFVLIGNGKNRAVWALNNLSETKKPEKLYDPEDAYGITAGQKYIESDDSIEKRLYTFAGKDTGLTDITGQTRGRPIIPTGSWAVYDGVPPETVHRWHTAPNAAPSGRGNHTIWYINNLFAGKDWPCSSNVALVDTGQRNDYGRVLYNYVVGDGFYHSFDYEVYSPFTYKSYGGWAHRMVREHVREAIRDLKLYTYKLGAPPFESINNVARVTTKVEGTMDLNGECCDGCIACQSNVQMPGVPSPVLASAYSAQVNRSYLYNRPAGKVNYTLLGKAADDETKGNGADITCNYIGISSKSKTGNYIYLLGSNTINQWMRDAKCPNSMLISNSDNLSGVACSDQWWQTGGIVYAYDKAKGKVYSFVRVETEKYDDSGALVTSGPPDEIDVAFDGVKPDKIGCDGFGNLYMLKTEYDPTTTNNFGKDGFESEREPTGEIYEPTGAVIFRAIYKQGVYKTVYKKPYGSDKIEKVKNRILLGNNVFIRRYTTEDDKVDSEKIWLDRDIFQTEYADDPVRIRTELAVINSPTPPRPDHLNSVTDCVGPTELKDNLGFVMATPDENGLYTSDKDLFFIVENAPYFDANGLNIGNTDDDMDGDGRVGRFPNTIKKSLTRYFWKIRRTHDREGNKVDKYAEENQVLNSEGDYILYFPSLLEGKFEVGVKVTYGYYDYSKLPVGSLASDKESVLVSGLVAKGESHPAEHPEDEGYSWQPIGQRIVEVMLSSEDRGVMMTGPDASTMQTEGDKVVRNFELYKFKPGRSAEGYGCPSGCGHPQCNPNIRIPDNTTFILDGYSLCPEISAYDGSGKPTDNKPHEDSIRWGMFLRDTSYNFNRGINRVASMTSKTPPIPADPGLVPGTLKWMETDEKGDNKLTIEWKADLVCGDKVVSSKAKVVNNSLGLTLEDLRELMPMPSEPLRYRIKATVSTRYQYEYYANIPLFAGGQFTGNYRHQRIPKIVPLYLFGECEVCVTDNTKPGQWLFNAEDNPEQKYVPGYSLVYKDGESEVLYTNISAYLKAATGEPISSYNSGLLSFYVADNNPLANYTGKRTVNKGETDKYHYKADNLRLKRLKCNFDNPVTRQAVLHFDTSMGVVPDIDKELRTAYTFTNPIEVIDEKEIRTAGMIPSNAIAYAKYEISPSKMAHFTKNADHEGAQDNKYSPNLDYDYATNLASGYSNRKFGISWQETCYADDNPLIIEDSKISDYKVGNIVIIDNDRPNIFIKGYQDRYPDETFIVPSEVYNEKWFASMLDVNSGPENWYDETLEFGGKIKGFFTNVGQTKLQKTAPEAETIIFREDKERELLTDIPVRFEPVMFDNVGSMTLLSFCIKGQDGSTTDLPSWNPNDITKKDKAPFLQHIFRSPGKFYVELSVKDNANSWPTNLNAPYTSGESANQKRTLRAYFEVFPSRFEYRILERKINGE